MWELTDDAVTLRQTVAAITGRVDEPALLCAYGALAFAAGPEPVWALELQRVGSLEQALPEVRASLLTGTADPLIEAARQVPRRHWLDTVADEDHRYQALRSDAELDRTGHFPREALVAAHLDGRPDRWREVARRLAAGTAAPVEAVIRDVVARDSQTAPLRPPTPSLEPSPEHLPEPSAPPVPTPAAAPLEPADLGRNHIGPALVCRTVRAPLRGHSKIR
ncbi:hypothetical protein ACFQ9X_19545 [Catenulispora yoronensis]